MMIRTQDRTCVCNADKMEGISIAEKSDGMTLTNADKIRNMSNEELAEIIMCPYDTAPSVCTYKGDCLQCCCEWFKQPAED